MSLLTLSSIIATAQLDSGILNRKNNKFFLGIGTVYSDYQDTKYSNVHYGGNGVTIQTGLNRKTDNYFWETGLNVSYAKEKAKTHNSGKTKVIMPDLYFKYLVPVQNNFYVGGRLDIIDFYFRDVEGLGNNEFYYINSSNLYSSIMYCNSLNANWNLEAFIDLGLLAFMKESTSFAFSAPQQSLEDGVFSYQNEKLEHPFGYKYFQFKPIWKILKMKTAVLFHYKKKSH